MDNPSSSPAPVPDAAGDDTGTWQMIEATRLIGALVRRIEQRQKVVLMPKHLRPSHDEMIWLEEGLLKRAHRFLMAQRSDADRHIADGVAACATAADRDPDAHVDRHCGGGAACLWRMPVGDYGN